MPDINYKAIGKRIQSYRKQLNITQAKLGDQSGIEPSNISHIERGATKASFPTLLSIANALGVTLDDLVYDNLKKSRNISVKALNELLADCSDDEIKAIVEMVKSTKSILRKK